MIDATLDKHLHNLAKNVDYTLKLHEAKFVLVTSDCAGEGKSTFLSTCPAVLAELYKKKILIYDCQDNRDDILESRMAPSRGGTHHFIRGTYTSGLDYLHAEDLIFLNALPDEEKASSLVTYFNEVTKDYDLVFINMKTAKRAEKSSIPSIPIDGAILIRSSKSINDQEKHLTSVLQDRGISIIGLVKNEGV